jgi:oxygen-independent coproporphyrinogen-3 oxidase
VNVPALPPLSLYVHLPWCVRKCPYCDFNSHAAGTDAPRDRYIDALIADLTAEAERARDRTIVSIFMGGGTPSLFSPAEIAAILDAIAAGFALERDVEITMEANPGTVERGSLAGYRAAGINRLSVGAQSFDADKLEVLGRIHAVEDISRTMSEARDAGLENINIDLMYALPGQDIEAALADIDRAVELQPTHVSWYHLTLEPNTVFYVRPPDDIPDNDQAAAIQEAGEARLAELGYERYEVSAYARDGQRCRHNLNYWSFGDYLGVGAGAHGKITADSGVVRTVKKANPREYMQSMMESRELDPGVVLAESDLLFEFMLNALRLTEGFDEQLFTDRTGLPVAILRQRAASLRERGLLGEADGNRLQPTPVGRRFLNELQAHFLPE